MLCNYFLIRLKACSTIWNLCPSEKNTTIEVMVLTRVPTTIALLNEYRIRTMTYHYILRLAHLSSCITVTSCCRGSQLNNMQRIRDCKVAIPKWYTYIIVLSSQSSGIIEEAGMLVSITAGRWLQERSVLRQNKTAMHMDSGCTRTAKIKLDII